MNIKRKLKELFFYNKKIEKILSDYLNENSIHFTYGQNAEDFILDKIFADKEKGFYVDVGAYHPKRFSNTYIFYKKGWRGINIDPQRNIMELFNKMRPDDINLEVCVANEEGTLSYYSFEEPAYNTISEERGELVIKNMYSPLLEKSDILAQKLSTIFERHLPSNTVIDFMTLDVETMELSVLSTNDWEKYRPKYIVMESLQSYDEEIFKLPNDPAIAFLLEKKYMIIGKMMRAVYFKDNA